MQINKHERVLLYTNVLFLIPMFLGIEHKEWGYTALIGVFIISSTVYHLFRKPGAEWWWHTKGRNLFQTFSLLLEITLAATLAVWGSWLLVNKSWTIFAVATIIFIPSFILFLSTDYKKYPLYHSIWHIGSAAIMILVLI
ncbi:hypothetical protein A3G06_00010 [Candidatus Nomurabacteria bacterium RIFCSPLOWO2_12_FULL_46_14]|uniref:Uncharacterized protein n=1 Tax=Candidatus Nomurabacteria bacterium RIFCSPLOWO2_12_FULL_46_14 TaxID=1801797 RepID=A0A1F6YCJ5_9BACT|nr:MAG: hypothetical protein A3G06_00010 [Candidatus Nomurabacteria bacterium RIFCSPLOWO2_12_FULL_46_14]